MNLSNKEINDYYMQAVEDFKESHPEWICTVKDGVLIIQLNAYSWKDFVGYRLSSEQRRYRHIVIIKNNGTVIDHDLFVSEENVIGLGKARISKSMFLGESGSFSYQIDPNKDAESECQEQTDKGIKEFNVQKFICEYFKDRGLFFYSPTRLWIGISFMFFSIVAGIIILRFVPYLPWMFWGYLAAFFLMGLYFVANCRQAINTLKIAGVTFIGVALAFFSFWPLFAGDLFFKLIFGFFIVLFLPLGIAIYSAGNKCS